MTTLRKSYPIAEFKTLGEPGEFEAIVSVFGNVDLQGDRVMPGAFTKSLQRWRTSGDPIPIIWSHDWADPFAHIGGADPNNVKQSPKGLRVIGKIDLDNPFGAQVYNLMKTRRVKEFSFSYEVVKERIADDSANELVDLELIEVGPTLKGANPETELIGVKAALEAAAKGGSGIASDDSEWDGNAAMTSASSAADYRAICAGEHTTGDPDERQHWALPHHKSPGAPANAAGVRQGRARFEQTQDLKNREAARAHLFETHKLPSETAKTADESNVGAKAGRTISKTNENRIRTAITTLEEVLQSIADSDSAEDAKADDDPENTKDVENNDVEVEEPVEEVEFAESIAREMELVRTRLAIGGS